MKRHLIQLAQCVALLGGMLQASAYADNAGHIVFVSGKADIGGQSVALNSPVAEGAELTTGADGYLYLKTIDNGFFILRPNSRARIVAYHVDTREPANTHIKLELLNGVARSISGDAVKQARQNFRFNTPVAAIGVRGTDFTVYTNQETSRIAVISGGVVASGFVPGCSPQGTGPCEGSMSAELFARQQGQLLQISKDQVKPLLLQSNGVAPDVIAPPRPDEPGSKAANTGSTVISSTPVNELNLDPKRGADIKQAISAPGLNTNNQGTSQIMWGRWAEVLGQPAKLDLVKLSSEAKTIAILDNFALFQTKNTEWQPPNTGTMGFALKDSEAYVRDEVKGLMTVAQIQNASLNVDFAKATFATNFDLNTTIGAYKLNSVGSVDSKGQFSNDNIFTSNMVVQGVLTPENGGAAAYLFKSRLDDTHLAAGATVWAKK
ncbi:FecR family protein [Undibacterium sp. SXout7W]|uniref:FecR family protein n=1 Tax=Undibacterium sp. SXout7W TaxID=3413049 RepID=UPI003BF3D917